MRRFPLVGGIDVSGTVASSSDARFKSGDEVLVTVLPFALPGTKLLGIDSVMCPMDTRLDV